MPNDALEREIRIAARPETVFQFFTDADKMLQWKGQSAEVDPQPGGVFQVALDSRNIARGEFVELVPYSRIVFTWGWVEEGHPLPPGASRVEVTLTPDGEGTILHLRHSGLSPEQQVYQARGWDYFLPRLVSIWADAQ